jgi:hypothetical protein
LGKMLHRFGEVMNLLAYLWLVTTEVLEEVLYVSMGDCVREFVFTAETRH